MSIVPSYSCTICVKKSQSDEEIDLTWPIPPIGTVGFRVTNALKRYENNRKSILFLIPSFHEKRNLHQVIPTQLFLLKRLPF